MEIWKRIKGYDEYFVSNKGNVKHIYKNGKERILKPETDKGYLRVVLSNNGKTAHFFIHQLVLKTFVGDCPKEYDQVNHIDNNPKNNCVENLEWCNAKMNAEHRDKQDRHNGNFKVYQYDKDLNLISVYWSTRECARLTGYPKSSIPLWCKGIIKPKNNDYIWSYIPLN